MLNLGRLRVLCEVVNRGSFSARRRGALLHPVGGLAGDRAARGRDRDDAGRPRPPRGVRPTAGRRDPGRARRDDLRPGRGRRGRPGGGARRPRRAAAGGLVPVRRRDADAARGRDAFASAHPDVTLTLAEGEPEEIAPRLSAGEFDLALLFEFPGVRERPGAGLRTRDPVRGPDARRAAGRPSARRASAALSLADLRDRAVGPDVGLEPVRPPRRAAPAWPPGSSRPCRSRATTTRPSRGWSRPASAWR